MTEIPIDRRPSRLLRIWTKLTAASTLFLIFAGAMVTSTGSGLAVPDWPLSYGMLMPPMVGGIFYEHGHRMIASAVGLITLVQAFWIHFGTSDRRLRLLGWLALAAVIVQGLLGGLTVIFLLPPAISVSHAALAEIFLCLTIAIAWFASARFDTVGSGPRVDPGLVRIGRLVVVVVFLQIVIGAVMRHLGAGLAIPDFPLSFGRVIPEFTSVGVAVNFAHRAGGMIVTGLVFAVAPRVLRSGFRFGRGVWFGMMTAVIVQVALGAFTIWSGKLPIVTSLHVVVGASILAKSVLFALAASAASDRDESTVAAVAPREQPA